MTDLTRTIQDSQINKNKMTIKQIFDEIANESGTNAKMDILSKYKDNELLKKVLYLANSKRVKFYIKQIPEYVADGLPFPLTLDWGVSELTHLSERTYTGHEGIRHLTQVLESLSKDDAYIIERIIDKDCKIGMGTRNLNKVIPDLIEKTGYMGCKPYSRELIEKVLEKGPCYSQEKMDGRFVNIIIQGGEVMMESRQGEPTILDSPKFLLELATLKDCVLNGELTMEGIPRYESNGIISSLITIATKKSEGVDTSKDIKKLESKHMGYYKALELIRVTAWDILTIDEYFTRKCKRQYRIRFKELNETVQDYNGVRVVETRIVSTLAEVMAHFEEVVSRDGEGTVVKSMDGVWADTKPSYQIKVKKEMNLDLRIVGFNYGTKGTKNENVISSLNVESEDGLLKTKPQGIDEDMMEIITANQDNLMGKIVEIKCSGLSQNNKGEYSTLHPVFKMIRYDKDIANTLEECIEINKSVSL
jgi:DNA ligase 1